MSEPHQRPHGTLGPPAHPTAGAKPQSPTPAAPSSGNEPAPARAPGPKRVAPPPLAPARNASEQTSAALAEWEGEGGSVLHPAPLALTRPAHRGVPKTKLP